MLKEKLNKQMQKEIQNKMKNLLLVKKAPEAPTNVFVSQSPTNIFESRNNKEDEMLETGQNFAPKPKLDRLGGVRNSIQTDFGNEDPFGSMTDLKASQELEQNFKYQP